MKDKWLIAWTCIAANGTRNFGNDVIEVHPLKWRKVMRKTLPNSNYTLLFAMKIPRDVELEDE